MNYSSIFKWDKNDHKNIIRITNRNPLLKMNRLCLTTMNGNYFVKELSFMNINGSNIIELLSNKLNIEYNLSKHVIEIPTDKTLVGFRIGTNKYGKITSFQARLLQIWISLSTKNCSELKIIYDVKNAKVFFFI